MRKFLIALLIVIVALAILWIFAGRQISEVVDRLKTQEIKSEPIHLITYEGSGDGGPFVIDGIRFDLAPLNPHVGLTKDNQLALSYGGKVFPFGPVNSSDDAKLNTQVQAGDAASFIATQSYLFWFDAKKFLGRNAYDKIIWIKSNGAKLEMVWKMRLIPMDDGRDGKPLRFKENLIRVEISTAPR